MLGRHNYQDMLPSRLREPVVRLVQHKWVVVDFFYLSEDHRNLKVLCPTASFRPDVKELSGSHDL